MSEPPDPDDKHLILADERSLPELDAVADYWDEVLRRDVADQALCGWRLPGKHFSRLILGRERPGQRGPDQVCERCAAVAAEYDLPPERLALVPPASWDGWAEEEAE